ncbi:MAG: hypothetical protein PUC37_04125 [Spirochaetales bacterium]|nr:hypothetical protein [Spirochaetales bacterium]
MKKLNWEKYSKYLTIIALVFIIAAGYFVNRHKVQIREAYKLPFYEVDLQTVEDGIYYGKTYTTFLHVQLNVKVENHKIQDIEVLECEGIDGETAKPILQTMIQENKVVVPAIKHAELGSLVYISCVSCALNEEYLSENSDE